VDLDLSAEHELLRETVRAFAEERVAPVAEELDREHRFPYDIVTELAELGLMGIPIAEEHGGAGGDTLAYAIAIEELTRIDSSVAITVAAHTSLGTMPFLLFGSEAQKREWLPDLASGRRLAAFGLTEPGAGSDAGATRTTAELDDGEWVVNGSKIFITNAGTDITACVTITARTGPDEISNIVVPNGTPGYVISAPMRKLGWRASDTRELSFEDCRVPEGNLLGPRGGGFRQFLEILDGGRISVAAMGLGLAQGAFEQALAYAGQRNAFGMATRGDAFAVNLVTLRPMAATTGGYAEAITQPEAITKTISDLSDDLRAQYMLGFVPANARDGKFHRIKVKAHDSQYRIRAKPGYIASP
jgi:alkylation response protein AidB-like acyl-CoA dehydrogenase